MASRAVPHRAPNADNHELRRNKDTTPGCEGCVRVCVVRKKDPPFAGSAPCAVRVSIVPKPNHTQTVAHASRRVLAQLFFVRVASGCDWPRASARARVRIILRAIIHISKRASARAR